MFDFSFLPNVHVSLERRRMRATKVGEFYILENFNLEGRSSIKHEKRQRTWVLF
jgi:hypothetical protein